MEHNKGIIHHPIANETNTAIIHHLNPVLDVKNAGLRRVQMHDSQICRKGAKTFVLRPIMYS